LLQSLAQTDREYQEVLKTNYKRKTMVRQTMHESLIWKTASDRINRIANN
jgi:hypothetical protein